MKYVETGYREDTLILGYVYVARAGQLLNSADHVIPW
jgi:hypothetical protein